MPGIHIIEGKKKRHVQCLYSGNNFLFTFLYTIFGTEQTRFAYQCNNTFIYP